MGELTLGKEGRMRGVILLLVMMAATLVLASGVALAVGVGSAGAQSSIVGPGESIQKAINAADPGDTIVVKGVHREDVIIRKNGIKLRGEDAVIEAPAPANADSQCSRLVGPEAICVVGAVNIQNGKVEKYVNDVRVSGFTIRGFEIAGKGGNDALVIDVAAARNTTITGNRAIGNMAGGIGTFADVNTTIANNDVISDPRGSTPGIHITNSRNATIATNSIRTGGDGIGVEDSVNATVARNHLTKNHNSGVAVVDSPGTKVLSNVMSGNGIVGMFLAGQKSANSKVVGNHISGGPWGIYVTDTHQGSFAGNTIHDNCAGMFFEAFKAEPVGGFKVKGNTVEDNTHSCQGPKFDRKFSGIGIALLGASGMEVRGNHLSGNVPSGPTRISGGVVVSTDPYFGVTAKPKNNSVIGNHFGRNKPDIFYDTSGSGNRFVGNLCNTSVPASLCN
jgi:parallel beta-helix repeat protein